eukprot:g13865.t1
MPRSVVEEDEEASVVNCLVECHADVNSATPSHETALFVAALRNQEEVVKILCRASADVNKATVDGATPLLVASQEGHDPIVKALLEAGADHCKRMTTGDTPISVAKTNTTKESVDESQGVFGYEWRPLSYIDEASAACHLHPVVRLLQAADVRAAADALAEGSRVVPSIAWRDGSVQMLQMMATAAETKSWLGQRDGSGCSLSSCEGMEKAVEALQYFKDTSYTWHFRWG